MNEPDPHPPANPADLLPAPGSMTLESIIDHTGEMAHLNELILLHLECTGGFTGTEAYFSTVRPILDQLEKEIRARIHPGMETAAMKEIIGDWIDSEIAALQ